MPDAHLDKPSLHEGETLWALLAALRLLLATIVLEQHLKLYVGPAAQMGALSQFFVDLSAFSAVVCFLVISGYSIAHSIGRQPVGFYKRRFARIYPLYLLSIAVPVLYFAVKGEFRVNQLYEPLGNALFLQTFTVNSFYLNPPLWSLAVEVACYALAPLFVLCSTRFLLGLTVASALLFWGYQHTDLKVYYAFLLGGQPLVLLGWAWLCGFVYHRHRGRLWAFVALGVLLMGLDRVHTVLVYQLHWVPVVLLLGVLAIGPRLSLPRQIVRPLLLAGDLSYPLYIFHYPVMVIAVTFFQIHNPYVLTALVLITSTFGLAFDAKLHEPAKKLFDSAAAMMAKSSSCRRIFGFDDAPSAGATPVADEALAA